MTLEKALYPISSIWLEKLLYVSSSEGQYHSIFVMLALVVPLKNCLCNAVHFLLLSLLLNELHDFFFKLISHKDLSNTLVIRLRERFKNWYDFFFSKTLILYISGVNPQKVLEAEMLNMLLMHNVKFSFKKNYGWKIINVKYVCFLLENN